MTPQIFQDHREPRSFDKPWEPKGLLPKGKCCCVTPCATGDVADLYFTQDIAASNTHEQYNIAGNSWASKTSPPSIGSPRGAQGCSVAATYAVGGNGGGGVTTNKGNLEYVDDTWTARQELTKTFTNNGICQSDKVGLNIWVAAALNTGSPGANDQTSSYLISANAWTGHTAPSAYWGYGPAGNNISDNLYITCGTDSVGHPQGLHYGYTIATDGWTSLTSATASSVPSGGSVGSAAYVVGGFDSVYLTLNQQYQTATWTNKTALSVARNEQGGTSDLSYVYAIGGHNAGHLSSVPRYDPVGNSWSNMTAMLGTPRYNGASGGI